MVLIYVSGKLHFVMDISVTRAFPEGAFPCRSVIQYELAFDLTHSCASVHNLADDHVRKIPGKTSANICMHFASQLFTIASAHKY